MIKKKINLRFLLSPLEIKKSDIDEKEGKEAKEFNALLFLK